MKQITAYVRAGLARRAFDALEAAEEAHYITLGAARGILPGRPGDSYGSSMSLDERFAPWVRLEIVCPDPNVEVLIGLVRTAASTARKGDGMIFVSSVEEAVRISDGRRASDVIPF